MRLSFKRALAALGCLAAPLAVAACSGSPSGDPEAGKALFTGACGSCHALADAGTKGVPHIDGIPVPNLDDAWRAAREAGMDDSTFEGIVRHWIEIAEPPMPRNILQGQEADDVAAYIASVAGRGPGAESPVEAAIPLPNDTPPKGPYGGEPQPPGRPQGQPEPEQETPPQSPPATAPEEPQPPSTSGQQPAPAPEQEPQEIVVDSDPNNGLAFVQKTLTAKAGEITFRLNNEASVPHNIAIRGNGVDTPPSEEIANGESTTLTVELEPGQYEYYCAVPGHEAAGMKGTLTVE